MRTAVWGLRSEAEDVGARFSNAENQAVGGVFARHISVCLCFGMKHGEFGEGPGDVAVGDKTLKHGL